MRLTPDADVLGERQDYLQALRPDVRARLAALVAPDQRSTPTALAGVLEDALADPSRRTAFLNAIPRDACDLLRLALAGGLRTALLGLCPSACDRLGWTRERAVSAARTLASLGLGVEDAWREPWDWLPGLEVAMAEGVAWLGGRDGDKALRVPFPTLCALLLVRAVQDPLRLTTQGAPYAAWSQRTRELLAPFGAALPPVERVVAFLRETGALREWDAPRRLEVVEPRAHDVLAVRGDALALAFAGWGDEGTDAADALCALARAQREAPRGVDLESLLPATSTCACPTCRQEGDFADRARSARGLCTLLELGLVFVEADGSGGTRIARRRAPEQEPAGRWVVQPNFDVLAAADVPPEGFLALGGVAGIRRADAVCTFTLSKESVGRRAGTGGPEAVLGLLRAHASHALPQNVEATLADWLRPERTLRPYGGAFVVTQSAEQAALIAGEQDLREVAPGVFFGSEEDVSAALVRARKAGQVVLPWTNASEPATSRPPTPPLDVAAVAKSLRGKEDEAARPPPPPTSSPGSTRRLGLSTQSAGKPRLAAYPRVAHALEGLPDAEALVGFLPKTLLSRLERLPDPSSIRESLRGALGPSPSLLAPRPAPPRAPAKDSPWRTLPPGELREWLRGSIEERVPVEMLYAGRAGESRTLRVVPRRIYEASGNEYVDGESGEPGGGAVTLRLDRIAAVREGVEA